MVIDLQDEWFRGLAELRYIATPKRIRALLDGQTVLDTRDALLVYEPLRVVPWYAVPEDDLRLTTTDHAPAPVPELRSPVLPPGNNEWHTTPGRSLHARGLGEVAFRPDLPDLGGRVIVRWEPFDWLEEDDPVVAHPRDPMKRIDVLHTDRHVRIEVDGSTVAESSRAMMLVETWLPVRWYLPQDDIAMEQFSVSGTTSACAYKGIASYLSSAGSADVAWFYPDPAQDALPVRDLVSFWEPATVFVDGEAVRTAMPGE